MFTIGDDPMLRQISFPVMQPGLTEQRATVLYANICGSTRLAERLGPERFGELLMCYYQQISETVSQHGGVLGPVLGDGVLSVFGAAGGDGHEDGGVAAGLALLDAIERLGGDLNQPLILGIGVNTGLVLAGYVQGQQTRRQGCGLTVIGDTVNIATALETIARPNRLVIGPATMGGLSRSFHTRLLGLARVNQRTPKLQAYEVLRNVKNA